MGLPRPGNSGGGLSSGSHCFGDAARRARYQHQSRSRRRLRRAERAHHPADRVVDGAVAGAIDPGDDDLVHPHRGGAVAAAHRARHRDLAAEFGGDLARLVPHCLRDGAGVDARDVGIKPLVANEINVNEAFDRASGPLRGFMEKNVRDKDLRLFVDMSGEKAPAKPEDLSMRILIPAFMISELKRAFEIGFLLFLPFLIIDLVVASVLMSMGMMMLPPVVVSLPFKLIFFVLVDG
jgi:hypothetical protein